MSIKSTQNFTPVLNLLRKICQLKSYRQKKPAKLEFVLFYTTNLQKFLKITFLGCTFFNYFYGFEIKHKILLILDICMQLRKKSFFGGGGGIEYIYEYFLKLVECKFASIGLKVVTN
jgi:hypothetical protein